MKVIEEAEAQERLDAILDEVPAQPKLEHFPLALSTDSFVADHSGYTSRFTNFWGRQVIEYAYEIIDLTRQ